MDVGDSDKGQVVYVLVYELSRTIAHQKMSSTSVSTTEHPSVHTLVFVGVAPTGIYVPLVSILTYVGFLDGAIAVGNDTSVAACVCADKPPWTVIG